jgi:hypothetical protein
MPSVSQRTVRTTQPQTAVGIDWSNPITRGLVACLDANRRVLINGSETRPLTLTNPVRRASQQEYGSTTYQGTMQAIKAPPAASSNVTMLSLFIPSTEVAERTYGQLGQTASGNMFSVASGDGTTAGVVRFKIYLGSTRIIGASQANAGVPNLAIARHINGQSQNLWLNGVKDTSGGTFTGNSVGFGFYGYNTSSGTGASILNAVWNRALTDAEIKSLSENPWQIFAPERRVVAFDADVVSGVIDLPIFGVEIDSNVESPIISTLESPINSVLSVCSAENVIHSSFNDLSNTQSISFIGIPNVIGSFNLSSIGLTGGVGNVSVSVNESSSIELSGISSGFVDGYVTKSINVSLNGLSSNVGIGDIFKNVQKSITNIQSNGLLNSFNTLNDGFVIGSSANVYIGLTSSLINKQISDVNSISDVNDLLNTRSNLLNGISLNSSSGTMSNGSLKIIQSLYSNVSLGNITNDTNKIIVGNNSTHNVGILQILAANDIISTISSVMGLLNLGLLSSSSSSVVSLTNNASILNFGIINKSISRNVLSNNVNVYSGNLDKSFNKNVNGILIGSNVNGLSTSFEKQIIQNVSSVIINGMVVSSNFDISSNLITNNLSILGKNVSKILQQNSINGYVDNVYPELLGYFQELVGVSASTNQGYFTQDRTKMIDSILSISEIESIEANLLFGLTSDNINVSLNDLENLFRDNILSSILLNSEIDGIYTSKQFLKILATAIYFNTIKDNRLNFNTIINKKGKF